MKSFENNFKIRVYFLPARFGKKKASSCDEGESDSTRKISGILISLD